jgi:hypothetical protein
MNSDESIILRELSLVTGAITVTWKEPIAVPSFSWELVREPSVESRSDEEITAKLGVFLQQELQKMTWYIWKRHKEPFGKIYSCIHSDPSCVPYTACVTDKDVPYTFML